MSKEKLEILRGQLREVMARLDEIHKIQARLNEDERELNRQFGLIMLEIEKLAKTK